MLLERRIDLQDNRVVVAGGIDGRDLPRPERIVESGANLLRREAEGRRLAAVDVEDGLWALNLQIQRYVLQHGELADFRVDERCKAVEFFEIARLQGVLVQAFAGACADL